MDRNSLLSRVFCTALILSGSFALAAGASAATGDKDAAKQRATPRESPGNWLSDEDYPVAALAAGAEGTTSFKLTVAEDGRVTDCLITISSGSDALDETTCTTLRQRARFAPARDAKNVAVADSCSGRITWRIPQRRAVSLAQFPRRLRIAIEVDEEGHIEKCEVLEKIDGPAATAGGTAPVDPCAGAASRKPMPVVDDSGQGIKARLEYLTEMRVTRRP